jgi:hypothetical protein
VSGRYSLGAASVVWEMALSPNRYDADDAVDHSV